MRFTFSLLSLVGALAISAQAESSLTLNGVHNCCKSCDKGIVKAVTSVKGATAETTKDSVTITASNEAAVGKAVAALLKAGYFGEGATAPDVTDAKVKSATVSGVHLCCGKCVTAADKAVMSVAGVTKNDATKNAESFTVEGDFSVKELAAALNKAGLNGAIK